MIRTFTAIIVSSVLLSGCGKTETRENFQARRAKEIIQEEKQAVEMCRPTAIGEYGSEVYYFPCVNITFARALAQFRRENPGAVVNAMASNNASSIYGRTIGYFVTIEVRQ